MHRRFLLPRPSRGPALALVLALAAAIAAVPAGFSRAQDNGLASITIYHSVCPVDYTGADYYADCYPTPGPGYTFDLVGPGYAGGSVATADDGFTAFEGITQSGTYVLTAAYPADVVDYAVVCSADGAPFPVAYVDGGVELELTTADDLRCDWFGVPVGPHTNGLASVTIYTAVCPPGYAGAAYFADCFANPGAGYTFALTGPEVALEATSGPAGIAFFEGLALAGTYTVTQAAPADAVGRAVFCGEGEAAHPATLVAGGFALELTGEDDLRCDWYVVPGGGEPAAPPAEEPAAPAAPTEPTEPEPSPTTEPTPTTPPEPTATATATATLPAAPPNPPIATYCPDAQELAMLDLINDYRAENGLGPLTLSSTLSAAAEYHSIDMATNNYFSHTLSDGTTWSQNLINHGYTFETAVGENIAAGYGDAAATFDLWVNSAPHRANMLDPNFTAIGIGRADNAGSTYRWYWTTTFGGYVDASVSC